MRSQSVSILEGNNFVVSDMRGDIDASPTEPQGLFSWDTRYLSRWQLRLDGKPLDAAHLRASDVHAGGRLLLELGPQPSEWGRKILPPSMSDPLGKGARS